MTTPNGYLKEQGVVKGHEQDFTRSAYVKGDFGDALQEAMEFSENPALIRYKPNPVMKLVDSFVNKFIPDLGDSKYSLLYNNCAHIAMHLLSKGTLPDGKNVGEEFIEKSLGFNTYSPKSFMNVVQSVLASSTLPESTTPDAPLAAPTDIPYSPVTATPNLKSRMDMAYLRWMAYYNYLQRQSNRR